MAGKCATHSQHTPSLSFIQVFPVYPLFWKFTWESWCFQEVLCSDDWMWYCRCRNSHTEVRVHTHTHTHTHTHKQTGVSVVILWFQDNTVWSQTSLSLMPSSSSFCTHTHCTWHCVCVCMLLFSWCTPQPSVFRSSWLITSSFLFLALLLPAHWATWMRQKQKWWVTVSQMNVQHTCDLSLFISAQYAHNRVVVTEL